MGSDPAPFFANLFLYVYESRWLTNLKGSDPGEARQFSNTFRFIDDLISMNDGLMFANRFQEIYPTEMELKKENQSETAAQFLDLDIKVIDGEFVSKLYDKRNSYDFHIVRFPHKCSNIPTKMFYSTILAEILRIAKATSSYQNFIQSAKMIIARMKKQGDVQWGTRKTLNKLFARHFQWFVKYGKTAEEMATDIL